MANGEVINVTRTFLPPFNELEEILRGTWASRWVTNQGPLAEELEAKLGDYFGVKHVLFAANGTIALQLAIRALGLKGEIITTPYSYVATATSIMWENCTPVFCDIDPDDFCIDVTKIEELITPVTSAILPTHVYGFPCDTAEIRRIADKHGLKVIYDGAHAFGVRSSGKALLAEGDVSAVSFHATKLFHTIEGGAVITDNDELAEKMFLYRAFGHKDDEYISIGINARNSEIHAAVGLCNLKRVGSFIERRTELSSLYRRKLKKAGIFAPDLPQDVSYNYSYFPVLFETEEITLKVKSLLESQNIYPRRYFYPSLNTLNYLNPASCPVSENVSSRVLCLPLFHELQESDVERICTIIIRQIDTN